MTFVYLAALTLLASQPAAPVVLRANPQGQLTVTARWFEEQVEAYTETVTEDSQPVSKCKTRTTELAAAESGDLATVKGLTFTTAGGKAVEMPDALQAIRSGAAFVASADGRPVDPRYLRLLADDTLVVAGKGLSTWDLDAPHLVEVKTDAQGEFARTVTKYSQLPEGSAQVRIPMSVEVKLPARALPATTAGGKPVAPADAAKAYAAGVTVVMSADGKPIDAKFLKLFKADTLVLTVKELVTE